MHSIPQLREAIAKNKTFAFDFETESETGRATDAKNPWLARPTLLSIASVDKAGVFEITEEVKDFFREIASNPEYYALAHNIAYDVIVAHRHGFIRFHDFRASILDTLALAWQMNEEVPNGLKDLVKRHLNYQMKTFEETAINNPLIIKRDELTRKLFNMEEGLRLWTEDVKSRKRPYPALYDEPCGWAKIRKMLVTAGWDTTDKKGLLEERDRLFSEENRQKLEEAFHKVRPKVRQQIVEINNQLSKELKAYALDDTVRLFPLFRYIRKQLEREGTWEWALKVEAPARRVCIQAEIDGMPIDIQGLQKRKEELDPIIDDLLNYVYEVAGDSDFNPKSSKDLPRVIFHDLGVAPPAFEIVTDVAGTEWHLPKLSAKGTEWCKENGFVTQIRKFRRVQEIAAIDVRTYDEWPEAIKKEGLSADSTCLGMLDHPIAQAVLDYRTADKLRSTYIDGLLPRLERTADGRIHCGFNSTGTKTGRLSSGGGIGVNLQNIPSRTKSKDYDKRIQAFGLKLRELFWAGEPDELAPEGYDLIVADQSQIELRLMADFSMDPNLLEAYTQCVEIDGIVHYTGDLHTTTASNLSIPRKAAKAVNFGFNYGMGGAKFARQNRILKPGTSEYDIEKATDWRNGYFQTYPYVHGLIKKTGEDWDNGVTEFQMISGRYRHLGNIFGFNGTTNISPGTILNSRVQGSSADIIKTNMVVMDKLVAPMYPGTRFGFQVHDELGYIAPKRFSREVGLLLKYVMEFPFFPLQVPILASAKVCDNWAAKDYDHLPEIGVQYAKVDGEDRTFTEDTWDEFHQADNDGRIEIKGATAMLTPEQTEFCKSKLPTLVPARSTRVVRNKQELMELMNG